MTIDDIRNLAIEKNIPSRAVSSFISEIEIDENGNIKNEKEVVLVLAEMAHNYDTIRGNLDALKRMKEKKKAQKK